MIRPSAGTIGNFGAAHSAAPRGRVLVVDDHAPARRSIADVLAQAGHDVDQCTSATEALDALDRDSYDVLITDLQMPGIDGLELMRQLKRRPHGAQIIVVTAHGSVPAAVEAMRLGALDFIEKPFDAVRIENLVARALRRGQMVDRRARLVPLAEEAEAAMVGDSAAMRCVRAAVAQAAPTDETILITGESGTGKELVARAIHASSRRAAAPLVGLNCPVLSAHLMESELFGHEKGAFTGADAARIGRFELAEGGTILLDEVSEIGLPLQGKLLRVLQERAYERVGSSATRRADVRVLATSNRAMRDEIAAGRFREDLYYRLAVVPIEVPPLRDRREDIPQLIVHFLARAAARLQRDPCRLEPDAVELLCAHSWPGNVRELENIVTRASVLATGDPIAADTLRPWLLDDGARRGLCAAWPVGLSLHEMERQLIEATLDRFDGHRARTACALGIGLRTLSGKLKEYGYAPRAKRYSTVA